MSQIPYPKHCSLGVAPTPIERLTRFASAISAPNTLWIKRDDTTGIAFGGNKSRKLEFTFADAMAKNADCIVTFGGLQSNHVRQTAAACAKLGLACHVVLSNPFHDKAHTPNSNYQDNGNVLLDELFKAHIHKLDHSTDNLDDTVQELLFSLKQDGKRPYLIPLGASDGIGAFGYVKCAQEILEQSAKLNINLGHIVLTTGSAGTHAGMLYGLKALGSNIKVSGISVIHPSHLMQIKISDICAQIDAICRSLGMVESPIIKAKDIVVHDRFVKAGYGVPDADANKVLRDMAANEGILLDPVYTAKAALGMHTLLSEGYFDDGKDVLLMHTGGASALFAYDDQVLQG